MITVHLDLGYMRLQQPSQMVQLMKYLERVETTNCSCFDHGILQTARVDSCRSGPKGWERGWKATFRLSNDATMGAEATKLGQSCVSIAWTVDMWRSALSLIVCGIWSSSKGPPFWWPSVVKVWHGHAQSRGCWVTYVCQNLQARQKQKTWHVNVSTNGTCARNPGLMGFYGSISLSTS